MKFLAGKTLAFRFVDSFPCIHRHFDEIFLTWNGSREELDSFIHRMNTKNSSIQVQSTIGTQIDYLEAHIRFFCDDNDHDMELETQVNHESKVEPYALPVRLRSSTVSIFNVDSSGNDSGRALLFRYL